MSQNNVIAFLNKVEKDAALQEQLRNLDMNNAAQFSEILKIATGAGFTFSADEWKTAGKQRAEALQAKAWSEGEISDEELANVAGGERDTQWATCKLPKAVPCSPY
jgi:predicted ribosomally synthesized peptide with nif11-like leader